MSLCCDGSLFACKDSLHACMYTMQVACIMNLVRPATTYPIMHNESFSWSCYTMQLCRMGVAAICTRDVVAWSYKWLCHDYQHGFSVTNTTSSCGFGASFSLFELLPETEPAGHNGSRWEMVDPNLHITICKRKHRATGEHQRRSPPS